MINAKKSLGQNFLIDKNIIRYIADIAAINENDTLLRCACIEFDSAFLPQPDLSLPPCTNQPNTYPVRSCVLGNFFLGLAQLRLQLLVFTELFRADEEGDGDEADAQRAVDEVVRSFLRLAAGVL